MPNYTNLINYALYDFNDRAGRVPFLDNSTARSNLVTQIKHVCSLTDS